jgi:hypothetical protein
VSGGGERHRDADRRGNEKCARNHVCVPDPEEDKSVLALFCCDAIRI